jgi:Dyp-type peroxidase family
MPDIDPLIDLDDIQGNVYPGFNKDHQTLRFLTIADVPKARLALAELARDVSTSAMVQGFAMTRAMVKAQRNGGSSGLAATWMNLSFGYGGLVKLSSSELVDGTAADEFKAGLAARSPLLGDPLDPTQKGHPRTWTIGGPASPPTDVVVTIAGDRREDVDGQAAILETKLAKYTAADGKPALRQIIDDLKGDTLGGDLNGHEHFGFKDGVSQPAIHGRPKSAPDRFITERLLDSSSPLATRYGRPGQVLLAPGQLLLGQPRQNGGKPDTPLDPLSLPADWLRNGSFMVLRVLEQNVPGFWGQMRAFARQVLDAEDDAAVDWTAARAVGRWRSGAPITRTPDADNPDFTADNRILNDFGFRQSGSPPQLQPGEPPLADLPLSRADPDGIICPFAAHIRKVNPRDDSVEQGSPGDTLTRLIFRRGVPYGPAFQDPRHAVADNQERGLIFVCYQASIARQFEFLMQNWVNGDSAPHADGGRDGVLGRHLPQGETKATAFDIADKGGMKHSVPQTMDFITPRGGGYFFTPSMTGLAELARGNAN